MKIIPLHVVFAVILISAMTGYGYQAFGANKVYKMIELVGTSETTIEDAIDNALARASDTLGQVDWFQVTETRGRVIQGKVGQYQVMLKVGSRLEAD